MATYLIIGNGIAGFSAALRLRKLRRNAEIYIFTKEKYPIYDRRDLPFFISGKVDEDYILLTDLDFYEENNINIVFSTVTSIDTDNYEIRLSDGEYYGYDKLIIASGSKSISKANQKIFQLPTYYFRTIDDAKSIKWALKTANNVVVIGGNQSSFTLAAELVNINKNVSLIIRKGNMTWNLFDDFSKMVISKLFSCLGVNFYPDVEISDVDRKKKSIKLSSGKQIPADIVIIDESLTPNIDFLRKTKIKVGEGIIVDHYFMTNVKDVYAIGEVAEVYDVIYRKNMPHQGWEIAKEQGELVAYNIVEPAREYMGTVTAIGFTIGKYNILAAGLTTGTDDKYEIFTYKNLGKMIYKKFIFDGEYLVGGIMITKEQSVDENKLSLIRVISRKMIMEPWKDDILRDDLSFYEIYTYFEKNIED